LRFDVQADELHYPRFAVLAPESLVMGAAYKGPEEGQVWLAKRGQRPRWIFDLHAAGVRIADLMVKDQ